MLSSELETRKIDGDYDGTFNAIGHFYGYEGRCAFPSPFDCNYCYSLGFNAGALIHKGYTGLMSIIRDLEKDPCDWLPGGISLPSMICKEKRKGKDTLVIKKALVELDGDLFKIFEVERKKW